jgi:hypothetical protein
MFFKNYGQREALLTKLLNKEAFSWTEDPNKYFQKIKEAMHTTVILATLDFTKKNIVDCDASGYGNGVVLMQ